MILNKSSFISRLIAGVRYLLLIAHVNKNVKCNGLFYIGKRNKIIAIKGGGISFGKNVHLFDNVEIQAKGLLEIGNKTTINEYSRIVAYEKIKLGNNCVLAKFVTILDHDHEARFIDGQLSFGNYITNPIIIGDNVWIGDKCTILKGVTIGSNVVVGANSLVNSDIPANCVAAGVPCRVIKMLN